MVNIEQQMTDEGEIPTGAFDASRIKCVGQTSDPYVTKSVDVAALKEIAAVRTSGIAAPITRHVKARVVYVKATSRPHRPVRVRWPVMTCRRARSRPRSGRARRTATRVRPTTLSAGAEGDPPPPPGRFDDGGGSAGVATSAVSS